MGLIAPRNVRGRQGIQLSADRAHSPDHSLSMLGEKEYVPAISVLCVCMFVFRLSFMIRPMT